ncbi:ralA-binding protein 1 isoform X3 [Lagenorhynchus albirostris]|uniref:ralA-binding protein 1 isoform X3 n=1 Tax=Lagenorhynchus albirostris TaxID=27610 RepID=UPI0028E730B3|nr:ralA-binding protein 1 isoform X3 [Lagenorhynchus albirostris]
MTECFLPPTSSPGEHRRVEHGSGLTRTPSSEEISPTKFPGLYRTGEPSPPHDSLHEPPDIVSDDEKDHGKKKGKFKKKEKRTEGYAAFQEDSSGDEAESPSKMKRSKGIHVFKKPSFSKKKEKDFKIKEKPKEEKHKEEKHKEEKHKEKKSKDLTAADVVKQWKEKKKKKKPIQEPEVPQIDVPNLKPIFGIPLADAVERTMMYDGVRLPAVFRECVDYVEKHGMKCEGIYRVSGIKSKVDELKAAYDREESPNLEEYEPNTVASLLKQYLRDLPENLLTKELLPRFEEACGRSSEGEKVQEFQRLLEELPECNRLLISWLIMHMDHVIAKELETKMNIQNISIVLSPTVQISNRVLYVFFTHVQELFGNVTLKQVTKPLRWSNMATMPTLPETQESIKEEIRRQECETKIAQEIASLSKEDVSKEEMNENEEVINILLAQENEILTEQEELLAMEQFLRRQIASEKEEMERLRAEIAEIQSRQQHGRSETEEYSSESESESEDEDELQLILQDLQRQNEELERRPRAVGGFPSLRQVPGQTSTPDPSSGVLSPEPRAEARGPWETGQLAAPRPPQHFTEHTNMLSRKTVLQNFSARAVGQAAAMKGTAPWSEQGPPPHLAAHQIKNNHLNQAIHEEREAIIELRVQLRLLQLQRTRPEPQAEPEPIAREPPPSGKEQPRPSPGRDRKETPI